MQVRGKGAVVTGGSRGLGAGLGRELARRGARVVLVARRGVALEATVGAIRAAGGEAHALVADVGDPGAAPAIAGAASALVGPVDVLIHSASSLGRTPLPPLLDTRAEELEDVLAVNLVGPFRLTRALAGPMALRHRGLVVHVSSDAAVVPYAGWGAYGVSKAALDHLGRIWAAELAQSGVRFVAIDPGEMATEMHTQAMPDADPASLADPAVVAVRIAELIESDGFASGERIEIARWAAPPRERAS